MMPISAEAAHVEDILRAARRGRHDPDAELTALLAELDAASSADAASSLLGCMEKLLGDARTD